MHITTLFGAEASVVLADEKDRYLAEQCAIPASNIFISSNNGLEMCDMIKDQAYAVIFNPEPYEHRQFASLLNLGGAYIEVRHGEVQRHTPDEITPVNNTTFTSVDMGEVYQRDQAFLGKYVDNPQLDWKWADFAF